jgi:hypothetical protein
LAGQTAPEDQTRKRRKIPKQNRNKIIYSKTHDMIGVVFSLYREEKNIELLLVKVKVKH